MISLKQDVFEALSRVWPTIAARFGEDTGSEIPGALSHPDKRFGDLSCNAAMIAAKRLKKNPMDIANALKEALMADEGFCAVADSAEVVAPGFVNIRLRCDALVGRAKIACEPDGFTRQLSAIGKGRKILLEHTSPNTNKSLHVGHLRNNIFGMALVRVLSAIGCDVIVDGVMNDRGIHICKAMWGYLKQARQDDPWRSVLADWVADASAWPTPESESVKPDHFVERFYGEGVKAEEIESNKAEMTEMLVAWEEEDASVRKLWEKMNGWVYQGFEETLKKLGSRYDRIWHESEYYRDAKNLVDEGLKRGVFTRLEDGAVLTHLESYGLPDTIVRRSDGTSMYFTQDIYLTKLKTEAYPDREYLWVVGPEQQLHLQQMFAVCEQLGIASRDKLKHFWYGYVFLKGQGKMSSRKGTVVSVDDLIREATEKAAALMAAGSKGEEHQADVSSETASAIGIAAIKYAMLKPECHQDIQFDWNETVSLHGNCGPYLQYVWTRCASVREKAATAGLDADGAWEMPAQLATEEDALVRILPRYVEAVAEAAEQYSPHVIANYLFELAQAYNSFYDACKIIGSESQTFRLALVNAVMRTIGDGLAVLGIKTVEKM